MKTNLILAFCLSIGMAFAPTFQAQETTNQTTTADKYVRLFLHNGGVYEGRLIEITTEHFLIETLLMGETKISKSQIATLTYIEQNQLGEMKSNNRSADINPQSSRYFFSPSAHALKQGEGYYHNVMLLYNSISYGLSDSFTAGIAMTPFGMGCTAKYSYEIDKNVNFSLGGIGLLPFTTDIGSGGMGIGFTNLTFGDERKNLSINYGLAWYKVDRYEYSSIPVFDENGFIIDYIYNSEYINESRIAHLLNLSGMFEVSTKIWILFETYFVFDPNISNSTSANFSQNPTNITLMGVRIASRKRDALWDWGMVAMPSEEIFGIPWISCTVPF